MSLLQEAAFARLLPEYERAFGEPPPVSMTDVDDVVRHMRERLRTAPRRELSFLDDNPVRRSRKDMGRQPRPGG